MNRPQLIRRYEEGTCIPGYMAHCYYNPISRENVCALYGFHWLVILAFRVEHWWRRHCHRKSWIDRMNCKLSQGEIDIGSFRLKTFPFGWRMRRGKEWKSGRWKLRSYF